MTRPDPAPNPDPVVLGRRVFLTAAASALAFALAAYLLVS
jgi:hypothetical protein